MTTRAILPDLAAFLDTVELADQQVAAPLTYGKSPTFNFGSDNFGFQFFFQSQSLISTQDQRSLITWVEKCIRTPRGVYPIYGPDYGTDLARTVGKGASVHQLALGLQADLERGLLAHPLIESIADASIGQALDKDSAFLTFGFVDALGGHTQSVVQLG